MPISPLADLTWEEARDALADPASVAILPVGAIEAHGPHLPLATDVVIGEAMARSGAAKLSGHGHTVILLPTLAYAAAGFAAAFPGTIALQPESVTSAVVEIARSLARHGLGVLAVANAHLDPAHLGSIEVAGETLAEEGKPRFVFPNLTRKPWATRLTEEFRSGACHAGRFETSVVMAIRRGRKSFEESGGPRAYFGYPGEATAAEGEKTIEVLGSILEAAVLDARG